MYEFGITHNHCGMTTVIYGYNVMDAFKRAGKDSTLWTVDYIEYID